MITRVTKVLIGKDMDRTALLTDIYTATTKPADGEILVLDKNKDILAVGSTVEDSDIIYIAQGTSETYNYSNDAGTAVTGARVMKFSDPIEGKLVKGFRASAYTAKTEQVTTITPITSPLTAGTEYVLRLVFKDIKEHRGQFSKTYRFISTTNTSVAVFNGLRLAIAKDTGARVTANAANVANLILTAKPIPETTTSVTDIDKFSMVEFDVYLNYIDSTGNPQSCTTGGITTTAAEYGSGTWELVRDAEKASLGYDGLLDQISFPIPGAASTLTTVASTEYNTIIIEHDRSYQSPDNQYVKQAPMTTAIFLPVATLQTTDVLAVLNPWMASVGFTAIAF